MPLKTLALLNPRKRRKTRKTTAKRTTRRRTKRAVRRGTYRNELQRAHFRAYPKAKRRSSARRRRSVSRTKTGGGTFKVKRISVLANPRRRSYRRSRTRCNPFGGGKGMLGQITGIFSKDNLAILAGGLGASVVVAQVTGRYGDKLPLFRKADGSQNPVGIVLYDLGLPVVAAMLLRKYAPKVAQGIIYGGLFKAAADALQLFTPSTYVTLYNPLASTSPASMYLGAGGGDSARATLGLNTFAPGYMGSSAFRGVQTTNGVGGALDNSPAFASDPFAARSARN